MKMMVKKMMVKYISMDKLTQAKLKRLIESSDWDVIYDFQSFLVEKWNKEEIKEVDQFNTLWNLAFLKGKIAGAKELLDNAEKLALDN